MGPESTTAPLIGAGDGLLLSQDFSTRTHTSFHITIAHRILHTRTDYSSTQ